MKRLPSKRYILSFSHSRYILVIQRYILVIQRYILSFSQCLAPVT